MFSRIFRRQSPELRAYYARLRRTRKAERVLTDAQAKARLIAPWLFEADEPTEAFGQGEAVKAISSPSGRG